METAQATRQETRSRFGKHIIIIVAAGAAVFLLSMVIWTRGNRTIPPAAVSHIESQPTSAPQSRSAKPAGSAHGKSGSAKHRTTSAQQPGEAQILVATGYRRMQQHDFEAARDAFEEALSDDPGNSAAREGLRAAKAAETVEGVAGALGR